MNNLDDANHLKGHKMRSVSCTRVYLRLYILIELNPNDLNFISIDRQKLDISKDVYL